MSGDAVKRLNLWRPLIRLIVLNGLIHFGCDSDLSLPDLPPGDHAIFVVCSGNYGASNARLDIIDTFYTNTLHSSVYSRVNQRALGGYACRMAIVDSFGLIPITEKDYLTVFHIINYQHQRSIKVRSPRDVVVCNNNIFVSSYMDSALVVLHYPSWEKQQTVRISHKSGFLVQAGGKIFVMNSDTLFDANKTDSVITIVMAEPPYTARRLAVGMKPIDAAADPEGQVLYIACKGRPGLNGDVAVLEVQSERILYRIGEQEGIRPVRVSVQDSLLAIIASDNGVVRVYDRRSGQVRQIVNIQASALAFCNGELLIGDAKDYISAGEIVWLNQHYQVYKRYTTGIYPAHFQFLPGKGPLQ